MTWTGITLLVCSVAGYTFFLGWWARGKALSDGERIVKILSTATLQEIGSAAKRAASDARKGELDEGR